MLDYRMNDIDLKEDYILNETGKKSIVVTIPIERLSETKEHSILTHKNGTVMRRCIGIEAFTLKEKMYALDTLAQAITKGLVFIRVPQKQLLYERFSPDIIETADLYVKHGYRIMFISSDDFKELEAYYKKHYC